MNDEWSPEREAWIARREAALERHRAAAARFETVERPERSPISRAAEAIAAGRTLAEVRRLPGCEDLPIGVFRALSPGMTRRQVSAEMKVSG